MKIFCIIPAFNEEKNIGPVVSEVKKYVDQVVVVDDGSVDQTVNVSLLNGAVVLKHIVNRGQGAALETGNVYALRSGADIVVHFDADGQFVANEIQDVVRPINSDECDIVFGSRFMNKKSNLPLVKEKIIIPLAHVINKLLIGKTLTDPQNGFRAMNRQALSVIKINQRGMAHCSEIIYKAFKNRLRIKEIPVTVIYNDFGQSFGGGVKIIKDLLISKLID